MKGKKGFILSPWAQPKLLISKSFDTFKNAFLHSCNLELLHSCSIAALVSYILAVLHHCSIAVLQHSNLAFLQHCSLAALQYCILAFFLEPSNLTLSSVWVGWACAMGDGVTSGQSSNSSSNVNILSTEVCYSIQIEMLLIQNLCKRTTKTSRENTRSWSNPWEKHICYI